MIGRLDSHGIGHRVREVNFGGQGFGENGIGEIEEDDAASSGFAEVSKSFPFGVIGQSPQSFDIFVAFERGGDAIMNVPMRGNDDCDKRLNGSGGTHLFRIGRSS
jgi:hypothetical protein